MRVVEPKDLKSRQEKRAKAQKRRLGMFVFLAFAMCVGISFWVWANNLVFDSGSNNEEIGNSAVVESSPDSVKPAENSKTKLKTFTGDEFKELYRSVNYPNVRFFVQPPEITGNTKADERIRSVAEKRGFVLTSIPVSPIVRTNEPLIKGSEDDLLQPLALKAWQELKKEAEEANIPVEINSAYRSTKRQRELFTDRLFSTGVTIEQIVEGQGDDFINETLVITAIPGYSRHHTGYTIDLTCQDGSGLFAGSSCYEWISKNNYEVAKKHGWIPSYPEDAKEQGPEPEPWEYVWVGTSHLYE